MSAEFNPAPLRYLARVVIEAATPLSVSTGRAGGGYDTELMVDVNGLPAIPGTAITGVLRHLYRTTRGEEESRLVFGGTEDVDSASALTVSWAALHDSCDQPVEGVRLAKEREEMAKDVLLKQALLLVRKPVVRDGVRITHRGVADAGARGRYDRVILPAGFRFTFEIECLGWDKAKDDVRWNTLLGLLYHPAFRLGGAARRGLGKLKVLRIHQASFDFSDKSQGQCAVYLALNRDLKSTAGLVRFHAQPVTGAGVELCIKWRPDHAWRVGAGTASLKTSGKAPDLLPKLESVVEWSTEKGKDTGSYKPNARLVFPASGFKGAIAHRIAFHLNRYEGRWTDNAKSPSPGAGNVAHVSDLFGFAGRKDADPVAGKLVFDDCLVEIPEDPTFVVSHNSIDRFTGGARDKMLFFEEMVRPVQFEWRMHLLPAGVKACASNPRLAMALRDALNDLVQGRLALGAGAANGHGFGSGVIEGLERLRINSGLTNAENAKGAA